MITFLRRRARHLRADEAATDPILVIAAIAVSLVLLVGGSFAVSGMIDSAKDLNAKSDLNKVSVAEAAASSGGVVAAGKVPGGADGALVFTGSGGYLNWAVTADGAITGDKDTDGHYLNEGAVGFTPTAGVATKVAANSNAWVAGSLSPTGKTFWQSSSSSKIYADSIPASAYDNSLTVPTLVPLPNAVADCEPTGNSSPGSVSGPYNTFSSNTAAAPTTSTVTYTLTGDGQSFCEWAVKTGLNLGGDSFDSGYQNFATETGSGVAVNLSPASEHITLTAAGGGISAQRTMTVTFTFTNLGGYTTAQLAQFANSNYFSFGFQQNDQYAGFSWTLPVQ